jgi:hypothetical protein
MTFDITQTIDHSIVTAYASGVASGVFIVAATLWLSSTFTLVTVDIPAALPIEIVVGLTAGVAVALFLCGYLLFTRLREDSEHTGEGGSNIDDDDGTVGPSSPSQQPIDAEMNSGGGGDPLEQRLERRSDLNNDGGVSESQTAESSDPTTDETLRGSSEDREGDRRSSDAGSASGGSSTDSERDSRGGVGATAREQRLKNDEDENGMAEASELPEAYRHELPNLRD